MLKNEVVQTISLYIKFSYLAENSKFSRSNSYFSILTPTFLRDGFLNSCFQNPSENSELGMCIDIVESWFRIANGQILSIFDRVICLGQV